MLPVPPICPWCNSIPEIDDRTNHFFCCNGDFLGHMMLIDPDNFDEGWKITYVTLVLNEISYYLDYDLRALQFRYCGQSNFYFYNQGEDPPTIEELKNKVIRYNKLRCFL